MMSVFKDKCLVVSKLGKEAQYLEPGGTLKDQPYFDLESSTPLVSIQLVDNEYVVAVFETFIKADLHYCMRNQLSLSGLRVRLDFLS